MKLYNKTLIKKGNELWLECYTLPKPNVNDNGRYPNIDDSEEVSTKFGKDIISWKQFKQLVEIHPSQYEAFKALVLSEYHIVGDGELNRKLHYGLSIPNDNIEIKSFRENFYFDKDYAFLRGSTISKEVKEEPKRNTDRVVEIIRSRIEAEYRKHKTLDWAKIAAIKIESELFGKL